MFTAPVRYSGFAIGTQLRFLLAGFAPSIAYALLGGGITGWVPVAVFTARETYRVPTDHLGAVALPTVPITVIR